MSSEQLSQFNALVVDNSLFDFQAIKDVYVDPQLGEIFVRYNDDAVKSLGGYTPPPAVDVVGFEYDNGDLIVKLSNNTEINTGRISSNQQYAYPPIVGSGLHVSGGLHKPLVSTDPNLTITETEEDVLFSASSQQGGGASGSGTFNPDMMASYHETVTKATAGFHSYGASVANGFIVRPFATEKYNGLGLVNDNGNIALSAGQYWIDVSASAFFCGGSYLRLVNSTTGEVLLTGLQVNAAIDIQTAQVRLSGYFYTPAAISVRIEQYTELAHVDGLGKAQFDAKCGFTAVAAKLTIFKTATSAPNSAVAPVSRQRSAWAAQWEAIYQTRKQIEYNVENDFLNATPQSTFHYYTQLAHGNKIYFIPNFNLTEMMIVNTETWEIEHRKLPTEILAVLLATSGTTAMFAAQPVFAEGYYYLVPAGGTTVLRFDPATETFTANTYGIAFAGSANKYISAAYDSTTRKIYAAPYVATSFLEIDVVTQTASLQTYGLTIGAGNKWSGAVIANGNLYCIPYDATAIAKINLIARTGSLISVGSLGNTKWMSGVYSPQQNKIVAVPKLRTDFLVIDCSQFDPYLFRYC